jgi:hypothetical protein
MRDGPTPSPHLDPPSGEGFDHSRFSFVVSASAFPVAGIFQSGVAAALCHRSPNSPPLCHVYWEYCRVILSHTERVKSFLFSGPFFSVLIEKNQIRA